MRFAAPLVPGVLIKRYKRFLADVRLADGSVVTATCPNTGSMQGLTTPDSRVWLSISDRATRKYPHTWELIEVAGDNGPVHVGVNTGHPNRIVSEAIEAGHLPPLAGYADFKREQKYGRNSRVDILLDDPARGLCYVEVKNVHLLRQHGLAEFPDSITERGAKHLAELAEMVAAGHRSVMVFLIQRADCSRFALARDIDARYGAAFDAAIAAGVEALALRCTVSAEAIMADTCVPIVDLKTRRAGG